MYLITFVIILVSPVNLIKAAGLSEISSVSSRLLLAIASNHTVTFTITSSVDAGETIYVEYPDDFLPAPGIGFADVDLKDDGVDLALAGTPSGATWGAIFSGDGNRTLTITSGTGVIAGGSVIEIKIGTNATFGAAGTKQLTNPTTEGSYTISIGGTFGDSGQAAVAILAAGGDQINVTGIMDPIISFSISNTSVGFGHFYTTNPYYATSNSNGSAVEPQGGQPVVLTGSTNAPNGLIVTVRSRGSGAAAGLYSTGASELISAAASSAVITNSKKYGVYAKNVSGFIIDAGFDNNGVGDLAIDLSDKTLATTSTPATNSTLDLTFIAAVDGATKAGTYSDQVTVICSGRY